jgi:hypothetical protein
MTTFFRAIVFEQDEESGARSVRDIIELEDTPYNRQRKMPRLIKAQLPYYLDEFGGVIYENLDSDRRMIGDAVDMGDWYRRHGHMEERPKSS